MYLTYLNFRSKMLLQHNKINFLTIFPNFRPNYALYILKSFVKLNFILNRDFCLVRNAAALKLSQKR